MPAPERPAEAATGTRAGGVQFETRPSPQEIPWSRDEQSRVIEIVRDCLREAQGSWQVTLTFPGALAHTWVVNCRRNGDGRGLPMLLDPDLPADVAAVRTALAPFLEAGEHAGPRETGRPRRPRPPAGPGD